MSLMAKILYHGFKLTGLKKMFALPQEEFIKKVNKINEKRGFFIPKDHKFHYEEQVILEKYSCLVIRQNEKPSKNCRISASTRSFCLLIRLKRLE